MIPLTQRTWTSQIHRDREWNSGYQGTGEKEVVIQ